MARSRQELESLRRMDRLMCEIMFDIHYEEPVRAREQACAWVGVIKVDVMGGIQNYRGSKCKPVTAVIPAAHEITIEQLGLWVTWLEPGDRGYENDQPCVLATWHQFGPIFLREGDPSLRHDHLIAPNGSEHEGVPLASLLFAAFSTEQEALEWTRRRSEQLLARRSRMA